MMKVDPILEEVWRIKDKLSREMAADPTAYSNDEPSWMILPGRNFPSPSRKEKNRALKVGDEVLICGILFTGRWPTIEISAVLSGLGSFVDG